MNACLILSSALFFAGCGVTNTWYSKKNKDWESNLVTKDANLTHEIYLMGDSGNPEMGDELDPVLALLKSQLYSDTANENSIPLKDKSVILLGDNVYDLGLPPVGEDGREEAEKKLVEQLDIIKDLPGKKVIIPGNHDWNRMREEGWKYVVAQQEFVDSYMNDSSVFQPKGGCPGPVEINVGNNTVIIAIDSEWWVFKHKRPIGSSSDCQIKSEGDFMIQLRNMVKKNKDKHIVLAMHHPMFSNGNHGGHYSLKDHIFPLTLVNHDMYIPLPVVGSVYPLMRKYGFSPEDLPNPVYQRLRKGVLDIMKDADYSVITTGHDHNLQLHQTDDINHIVSGAGSKQNFCVKGKKASFVGKRKGFSVIKYYDNGEAWVEFWSPLEGNPKGELLFRKPLYAIPPSENSEVTLAEIPSYEDSTKMEVAGSQYTTKGVFRNFFVGKGYRDVWTTPVEVDYLDMKTDKGGLTPIKMGGGQQTMSLRLMGGDGNQYTLRSINKDLSDALPSGLRETFAKDLVQDGISGSHPYSAFAIPKMAEAVDVYHTSPEVKYVPFTPSLGQYMDEMAGMLALMEIRPDEDLSEFRRFGSSENVVGTEKMMEQLREDNDNEVDDEDFLRARLLDLLIGDWDRHADQWRWAEFDKDGDGEIMRPVPRDRDQAFVRYDGFLSGIAASKNVHRNLSNFGHKVEDLVGLMLSGMYLDRKLLSDLDREDWEKIAKKMQEQLDDETLDNALRDMPKEIYEINGEITLSRLKQRRDDLYDYAMQYYEFLAQEVDISLTDKEEFIKIERLENGDTRVRAYKRDWDPGEDADEEDIEQKLFDRTFKYTETDEIRVYADGGRDSILVSGESKNGILVRIVGGSGDDYIEDKSSVRGLRNKTVIYELEEAFEKNTIVESRESKTRFSDNPLDGEFYYMNFKPDLGGPKISFEYDRDFGFFLGAGYEWTGYGFRAYPYKTKVSVIGNHSLQTSAFNFKFMLDKPVILGPRTGLLFKANIDGPDFVRNYFGQSNESEFDGEDIMPFRIGMNHYEGMVLMTHRLSKRVIFRIGPHYEYADLTFDNTMDNADTAATNLMDRNPTYELLGGRANFDIDLTDNHRKPTRGLKLNNFAGYHRSINNSQFNFLKLGSNASFYLTPNIPIPVTFALRLGVETNIGDFPFYQSAMLDGTENVRGYRRQRFSGHTLAFQNLEMRVKVTDFNSYILGGKLGVYGFFDNGRVWARNEDSNIWHNGYGGGLWIDMYDLFLISGGVGFSEEGSFARVNFGYFF